MPDLDLANRMNDQIASLVKAGRLDDALLIARQLVGHLPNSAAAFTNLATILSQTHDFDAAIDAAKRAIALNPEFHGAHSVLAGALEESGDVAAAVDSFERAARLAPGRPGHRSAKLYAMEFLPRVTQAELFREQRKWDSIFGRVLTPMTKRPRSTDRLRIGYVSAFFYRHAEAFFLLPLLESHDHSAFEIHCYCVGGDTDDFTNRHCAASDHWHECRSQSIDELVQLIRHDQIDILVDLMMHMGKNRAPLFAQRAAPVQIAWLAYPGGTGMAAMDYRITDPWLDPPGADEFHTEKSLRLPQTWCCYDPMIDTALAAPRDQASAITFGSLNNPRKLNDPLIRLWARILQAVPDSRIVILSSSQNQQQRILEMLASNDVRSDRVTFIGRMRRADYLRAHDRIDIALDTLPYNGITTTLDALWMGVPVVTLPGNTAAGRAGFSIMHNVGLSELAASDPDHLVSLTTSLASDSARLNHLRANLRARMQSSPLMNGRAFARTIEAAYLETCK